MSQDQTTPTDQHVPGRMPNIESEVFQLYGSRIIMAVGAVALTIVAAVLVSAILNRGGDEEAWSSFAEANSAEKFGNVSVDNRGSSVAVWARLMEAELLFNEALNLQFRDSAAAKTQLASAKKAFEGVLKETNAPPEATEKALLGHARLLEATCTGNTEEPIKAYQELVSRFPESLYRTEAESRIEALKRPDTAAFYAWFSKQSPKIDDRNMPRDGLPAGHPDIMPVTLPPIPDELYPADWSELKIKETPDAAPSADGKPAAPSLPEEGAKPEGDAKPGAAEKSNTEAKPDADAKPTEKPATDAPAK